MTTSAFAPSPTWSTFSISPPTSSLQCIHSSGFLVRSCHSILLLSHRRHPHPHPYPHPHPHHPHHHQHHHHHPRHHHHHHHHHYPTTLPSHVDLTTTLVVVASTEAQLTGRHAPVFVKPPLDGIVGAQVLPRSVVIKRISEYVKRNGLQHPSDKRMLTCDENLKKIYGQNSMYFLQLQGGGLNKYLLKPEQVSSDMVNKVAHMSSELAKMIPPPKPTSTRKKSTKAKKDSQHDDDHESNHLHDTSSKVSKPKTKTPAEKAARAAQTEKMKKKKIGIFAPLKLSRDLSLVCEGKNNLARPDIIREVWAYLRRNDLLDQQDKRFFFTDHNLKKIFGTNEDRVSIMKIGGGISKHVTKIT